MNSELYSGGADRPDRWDRGDRGDLSPEDDPGPDVTPVPASADYRAPGITRQEAYAAVGQADQTPNAFLRHDADQSGADRADSSQSGADRGQDEGATAGRDGSAEGVTPADRERPDVRDQAGAGPDSPQPQSQDQAPEMSPKAAPDARTDDDRLSPAMEQRVNAMVEQRVREAVGDVKAENADLRAENAEIRQQLGETNAKLDEQGSKLDAILAALGPDKAASPREAGEPEDPDKADADQRDRQPSPDRPQDEDRDRPDPPERPDKPDATKPDQRNDALGTGDDAGDSALEADKADIQQLASGEAGKEGNIARTKAGRHVFTAENIGAVGAGVALYQSVGEAFAHLPPEVGIGASALGFIGASMATSFVKNMYKKWKDWHGR
ncbi:MAG: hypothetical protein J2P25_14175 [Nocardiopsaceae bacterium]|nr:hypothetical protein [Nocardiopsaceae bacterium]